MKNIISEMEKTLSTFVVNSKDCLNSEKYNEAIKSFDAMVNSGITKKRGYQLWGIDAKESSSLAYNTPSK